MSPELVELALRKQRLQLRSAEGREALVGHARAFAPVFSGIDRIAERVKAHHDAGADHVCLQVVSGAMGGDMDTVRQSYRDLAAALL